MGSFVVCGLVWLWSGSGVPNLVVILTKVKRVGVSGHLSEALKGLKSVVACGVVWLISGSGVPRLIGFLKNVWRVIGTGHLSCCFAMVFHSCVVTCMNVIQGGKIKGLMKHEQNQKVKTLCLLSCFVSHFLVELRLFPAALLVEVIQDIR